MVVSSKVMNEEHICDLLQDSESKKVFDARRHYMLTKEQNQFYEVFVNRLKLVSLVKEVQDKSFVMFSGSVVSLNILMHFINNCGFSKENCKGVWDNDPFLHDKFLWKEMGYIITPPDYSILPSIDKVLIALHKNKSADEITDQLVSKGLPPDKIVKIKPYGAAIGNCGYALDDSYFDKDIILPRLLDNEVFVDAGSMDFGTSSALLKLAPSTKRIYAFEPDSDNLARCMSNIAHNNAQKITEVHECALWSSNTTLDFWVSDYNKGASAVGGWAASVPNAKVNAKKLDEIVRSDDKVTFIKMDVEGSELEALNGSTEIICRDKPKLAISIYHKPHDYVEIPSYIYSIVPEYKFYMRHYTPNSGETVLYCVI